MRYIKESSNIGKIRNRLEEVKKGLARCIAKGGLFIINMDDSDVSYSESYEPNIKEFYQADSLPS